jgi:hypothetical protein
MVSPVVKDRISDYNLQLARSAAIGFLKGTLIGLVSGVGLSYRYNRGVLKGFFRTPYKFAYVMCWGVTGLIFDSEVATHRISRQVMIEEELRNEAYYLGK